MSIALLDCQRLFQIWEYTVGHRQLLLRSVKATGIPTRIDILFKDVAAIQLRTTLDGLTISEATEDQKIDLQLQTNSDIVNKRKVFIVRGLNFEGYVVAGALAWHEDEGEYDAPSYFRLKPS
jgi:hypothetical protein